MRHLQFDNLQTFDVFHLERLSVHLHQIFILFFSETTLVHSTQTIEQLTMDLNLTYDLFICFIFVRN